jgi:hypothetical protein
MKLHCIFQSKNKKQSWEKRRGEGTILDSDTDSHRERVRRTLRTWVRVGWSMRVRRRAKGSSRRPRALTRGMSVMANRPDPPRPRSVPTVASTRWRRSSSGAFLDKRRIRSENDLPWRWRGWRARWRRGRQRGRVGWWCNGGGCLTGSGRREGEGAGGGRARRGLRLGAQGCRSVRCRGGADEYAGGCGRTTDVTRSKPDQTKISGPNSRQIYASDLNPTVEN